MADPISIIEQAQSSATGTSSSDDGISVLRWLAKSGEILPAWWSAARDKALAEMWKSSNHLSIAVYNTQSKMVGIPMRIIPRDPSVSQHMDKAYEMTELLIAGSEFGRGWDAAYAKFVEDYLCSDNGAFMEIVGDGPPDGRIVGSPYWVRNLDSMRCTRTSDPVYPVRYVGEDGRRYKFHWSRIIYMSQMPSPRTEMNNVGFCSVSRAADIAQTLTDMINWKQERLGSRPPNQIVVGKGLTGMQIMEAFYVGDQESDNRGHSRYAKTVAVGSENPDIDLKVINLTHMEPFDEETTTTLGMFAIAAAFGMDASEIWPGGGSSANQADAALRRIRSRGKLPSQLTKDLATQLNLKFLPEYLKVEFDFKDDEEDQQRAVIKDIRGRNRERDIGTGTVDIRSARQNMLMDGDIDRGIFEMMEMTSGRLPDGSSIGILFYADEPVFKRHLTFSGMEPLMIHTNDPEEAIKAIESNRTELLKEWAASGSDKKKQRLMWAHAALDWLQNQYEQIGLNELPEVPLQSRRQQVNFVRLTREDGTEEEVQMEDA